MNYSTVTNSADETIELGRCFGSQLKGGEVIGVYGNLGSGKTHFIKGLTQGAGAGDCDDVNSPTFVIVNEYKGRLDVYHIDAYRLENPREFEGLGFDDMCYPDSVVVIEWADKVDAMLEGADVIKVELCHNGGSSRGIRISSSADYLIFKIHF